MNEKKWYSEPVGRGSVSKLILQRIKEAFVNKELKPGDYLPTEVELAQSFGVGKGSVREAVKMLEGMGIVEIKRGQGTLICTEPCGHNLNALVFQMLLHQGSPDEIIEMRGMFETAFTIMGMHKATPEDIAKIGSTIEELKKEISENRYNVETDIGFHMAILESTHNYYVKRIGETIFELFRASISKSVHNTPELVLEDHEGIFEAFCNKDEEEVQGAIWNSLAKWRQNL